MGLDHKPTAKSNRGSVRKYTLVLIITGISIALIMLLISSVFQPSESEAIPSPQFIPGSLVQISVPDRKSVSVYTDCPGALIKGVLGLATDGQQAQVLKRQVCDGVWWYQVAIEELDQTDWEGTGWINTQNLKVR